MVKRNDQSGFTLIELMVSMAAALTLLAAMLLAFTGQTSSYNSQQEISAVQEDMWAGLQLMSRDLRMAGYDLNGTGLFGVITADATTFQASQDINENGIVDAGETYTYAWNGTALTRDDGGGAQVVVNNITNMAFEYESIDKISNPWSWSWAQVPGDLTALRVVKICLQGRTNRQTSVASDTSNVIPPFNSVVLDWTPAADRYQRRIMCVQTKMRNFQD